VEAGCRQAVSATRALGYACTWEVSMGKERPESVAANERRRGWVTTGHVAKALGVTRQAVRDMCEAGRIPGAVQLFPGRSRWRIPREWLDRFRAATRPVRRQKTP